MRFAWLVLPAAAALSIAQLALAEGQPSAKAGAAVAGIDLSTMSIEDAVILMMMMTANDARADIRTMLSEMDSVRKRRAALRGGEEKMRAEADRLAKQEEALSLKLQAARARLARVTDSLSKILENAADAGSVETTIQREYARRSSALSAAQRAKLLGASRKLAHAIDAPAASDPYVLAKAIHSDPANGLVRPSIVVQ